ncbi:class I SAM-dependent methyltransferase [uncultured Variovorax sp.]|uniref:class I SAM-dependent methyltransferase n=1 Tax=uncultured Variovorax sp. TaxID=114708 RepID=UPI002620E90D|nr:class I SAM-dependent methyltransferase [uncultured Variovorax sp.]
MTDQLTTQQRLHQWFTPAWAAEGIVEQEFGWLQPGHRVADPACGDGAFLCAIPDEVEAIGVEIDPVHAQSARLFTGRPVITGDFLEVPCEQLGPVHAVIGNPPFQSSLVAAFLNKAHQILVDDGVCGLILPAYVFQTSSVVEKLNRQFSIRQQLLPRNLFQGIKLPLVFATFTKERDRRLFGFLLYNEAQEMRAIDRRWAELVTARRDRRGVWFPVVEEILNGLGGDAELEQIYLAVQSARPTGNVHWKAKVRQTLQRHPQRFARAGQGRYRLCADAGPDHPRRELVAS